jgi:molybdenum cofactor cytidylyltransferase
MKFGDMPLAEAEGAILAHSVRLAGRSLKKGRVLAADDIAALRSAGRTSVVAARIEPGDVHEDAAANALAAALKGKHVRAAAAFTGRANLFAEVAGVVDYDLAQLDRFNLVDEAVTLALVPRFDAVEAGQMIGTLKIIPFAVAKTSLDACAEIAGKPQPLLAVRAFSAKRTGLIQTTLPGLKSSVLDGTVDVTQARLARLSSPLIDETRCEHSEAPLATAIRRQLDLGCNLVLVAGASAVVDRRDVIPAAVERAGGRIEHFGMPVDPGNLILLGRIGEVPVVGLPGCARSPKFNGFDWVLQRLVADLPIGRADIMRMGAGGLLKEIATRPLPRAGKVEEDMATAVKSPAWAPRVAAIVLAGGQSRRMGSRNKLLAEIDGTPMVARVVDAVSQSRARPVIVVTGHQADRVRQILAGRAAIFVHNPEFAEGLSTSLKAGLSQLPDDVDAALVCLGDMPRVTPRMIDRLIAAYDPVEGRAICVPTCRGKRGNPVLWDRRFFAEMQSVAGDVGARHLIGQHAELVAEVEMDDDGVLIDIDTPQALTALDHSAKARA